MYKDFDRWNVLKKKLDIKAENKKKFIKKREIWWCSIGLNIGSEQNGKNILYERPVLVLKRFNSEMFLVIPITSKNKTGKYYYKLLNGDSVIISQLRFISIERMNRKINRINKNDFVKIQNTIIRRIMN